MHLDKILLLLSYSIKLWKQNSKDVTLKGDVKGRCYRKNTQSSTIVYCYIPKKLLPARTHPTDCSLWTTKVVDNKWTELRELSKIRLLLPGTLLTQSEFTVGFFRCCWHNSTVTHWTPYLHLQQLTVTVADWDDNYDNFTDYRHGSSYRINLRIRAKLLVYKNHTNV